MKSSLLHIGVFLLAVLGTWSCERQTSDIIDPDYSSPFLAQVRMVPDHVNLDLDTLTAIALGQNQYRLSLAGQVAARRQLSTGPFQITAEILMPGSSTPAGQQSTGISFGASDTLTATVPLSFVVERSDIGALRLRWTITAGSGRQSNSVTTSIFITRRNSPPRITHISMPDTVTIGHIPSPDSSFLVTATVADSDGIADVPFLGGVQFLSTKPDSTPGNCGFPVFLFDDGNELILFPPDGRSGDAVAGDGVFSFRIRLLSRTRNNCPPPDSVTTMHGDYVFRFYAVDASGASSDTIAKTLTVR